MNTNRLTAYGLLLITSIIWGIAGPVIKRTLGDFPPLIFLTYRFGISALIGFLFILPNVKQLPKTAQQWLDVALYSIFIPILGLGLLFFGFDKTTSMTGSLIAASGPIFVAIAGAIFFREKITGMEKAGMGLAIVGTLITTFDSNGLFTIFGSHMGNILILLSCFATALGFVFSKRSLYDHLSALTITNLGFVFAFCFFLPLSLFIYSPSHVVDVIQQAPLSAHLGVLYMAVLSGTVGYFFNNWAEKKLGIGETALFSYLQPVWAAPIAVLWLSEQITPVQIFGAILVVCGVMIAEYRKRIQRKQTKQKRHRK